MWYPAQLGTNTMSYANDNSTTDDESSEFSNESSSSQFTNNDDSDNEEEMQENSYENLEKELISLEANEWQAKQDGKLQEAKRLRKLIQEKRNVFLARKSALDLLQRTTSTTNSSIQYTKLELEILKLEEQLQEVIQTGDQPSRASQLQATIQQKKQTVQLRKRALNMLKESDKKVPASPPKNKPTPRISNAFMELVELEEQERLTRKRGDEQQVQRIQMLIDLKKCSIMKQKNEEKKIVANMQAMDIKAEEEGGANLTTIPMPTADQKLKQYKAVPHKFDSIAKSSLKNMGGNEKKEDATQSARLRVETIDGKEPPYQTEGQIADLSETQGENDDDGGGGEGGELSRRDHLEKPSRPSVDFGTGTPLGHTGVLKEKTVAWKQTLSGMVFVDYNGTRPAVASVSASTTLVAPENLNSQNEPTPGPVSVDAFIDNMETEFDIIDNQLQETMHSMNDNIVNMEIDGNILTEDDPSVLSSAHDPSIVSSSNNKSLRKLKEGFKKLQEEKEAIIIRTSALDVLDKVQKYDEQQYPSLPPSSPNKSLDVELAMNAALSPLPTPSPGDVDLIRAKEEATLENLINTEEGQKWNRKLFFLVICGSVGFVVIFVVALVAAFLVTNKGNKETVLNPETAAPESPVPTLSQTLSPTLSPTSIQDRLTTFVSQILNYPDFPSSEAEEDVMLWLTKQEEEQHISLDDEPYYVLERYVLALLFRSSRVWLPGEDVCDWGKLICNANKTITELQLCKFNTHPHLFDF